MVNQQEAIQIAKAIKPIFQEVLAEYDFGKYPANSYSSFQVSFSKLNPTADEIKNAMLWKWGHWGKDNYPQHHKNLIGEIQTNWQVFCNSGNQNTSAETFEWWGHCLNRKTTYITVAYITHLIHNQEPLPIIDQHNFRAMNHLTKTVRPIFQFKKKPSNWQDIQNLKGFMKSVVSQIPGLSFQNLDKFLMMYGRNHVQR